MKKALSLMVLAASLLPMSEADAQVKFGVKGGWNLSSLKLNDDMFTSDNKNGFFIGPMVKVSLPLTGLGFDVSALYNQREAKMHYASDVAGDGDLSLRTTIKQKTIDVPVNLRYSIGLASMANVYFFGGPQWSINVGDENFKWDSVSSYSLKKNTLSFNIGAGLTFLQHIQASVNYNIEASKSGKMEIERLDDGDWVKGRNHTWQVSLGYWF